MEFNLKKVLKTLLFSTADAVSIKDIQAVITRYHEQREKERAAGNVDDSGDDAPPPAAATAGETPETAAGTAAGDAFADTSGDASAATGDAPVPPAPLLPPESPPPVPHRSGEVTQQLIEDIIEQVPTLLTATQIREAMDDLNQAMIDEGAVTRILQGPEGFRLVIAPDYAEWVRLLRNDPKPLRLSQSALETLAVIAYRQPVTRSEIESIRGVSADNALARLIDLELALVTGRADLPGRPIQYGTTEKFLDFCGLRTLADLPASDVLSPSQISEWIARATNPQKLTANDVGLAEDDGTEERKGHTSLLDGSAPPAAATAPAADTPAEAPAPVAEVPPPATEPPPQ
jgi:segregation and condensation protein B